MALKDPVADTLVKELLLLRREAGVPGIGRLADKDMLIDALGMGDLERAWIRLERLREQHGDDPQTDVGAFFYLAGWGARRSTLEQRIEQYAQEFNWVERTARRRGDRGAQALARLIRHEAETTRPWGLITVFQSGTTATFVTRLVMAYESWRPATVYLNDADVSDPQFVIHRNPDVEGSYYHQLILDNVALDLTVTQHQPMARLSVHWPMPVWPTWQVLTYIADPLILVKTTTYRSRSVEVALNWGRVESATEGRHVMARDGRRWTREGCNNPSTTTKRDTPA